MQTFSRFILVLAAMAFVATSASALERRAVQLNEEGFPQWNAGSTYRVSYYNICTGWVWCWGGFGDDGVIGQTIDATLLCDGNQPALLQTVHFLCSPAPAGYGFTGTIDIHSASSSGCPKGPPIASQPFLPSQSPFQAVGWGGVSVPPKFVVVVRLNEERGLKNPAMFGTDHPAAGPTGPEACGNCYPADREAHSFFTSSFGTGTSIPCPGSRFDDGVCNAELFWSTDFFCGFDPEASSADPSSWGCIKALYRE